MPISQTFSEVPKTAKEVCVVTACGAITLPLIYGKGFRGCSYIYLSDANKGFITIIATLNNLGLSIQNICTMIGTSDYIGDRSNISEIYYR